MQPDLLQARRTRAQPDTRSNRGKRGLLPLLGVFAGALVHSLLPRGAFGTYDIAIRAAITGAATGATILVLLVVSKRRDEVIAAHAGCTGNREALAKAGTCGCFYCCSVFSSLEIEDWVDPVSDDMQAGNTALCPRCGIDSVIPLQPGMNVGFLRRMKAHWF